MAVLEAASTLTDDQLRERLVDWLRENLPPLWVEAIEEGDDDKFRRARDLVDYDDWCARLGEAGWATPTWPAEYGFLGLSGGQAKVVNDELNRWKVPRSFNIIGIGMGGPTIMHWGTDEQKQRLLKPMAKHEEIWCQLFSEPGSGSDVASLATRAVRDGEEWVVNGQKVWTTLAHMARWGLLVARTDPDQPKHRGLTYFVIDMRAPGVEVRPLRQITGDAEFNEVYMTEVRIPDAERLGEVGDGWRVSLTTLMNERVAIGGTVPPRGSGPITQAVRLWDRRADKDPALRDRVARLWIDAEVTRLTNLRAQQLRGAGTPGPEGSIAKIAFAELNQRIYDLCVDLLGPEGTLYGSYEMRRPEEASLSGDDVTRMFLRARANSIEGGTSEILRNVVGERVLGLPPEPRVDKDRPWSEVPRS